MIIRDNFCNYTDLLLYNHIPTDVCIYTIPCMHFVMFHRLIVLDPLLCDVLRKKGNPADEKLTWQEATQR